MKSRKTYYLLVGIIVATLTLIPFRATLRAYGPTVAYDGDSITVNGGEDFLFMVSYFDGIDTVGGNLERDLAQLRAWGVDGIRVFAMWSNATHCSASNLRSVINSDGSVNSTDLDDLKTLLETASNFGMIVDLSFAPELVSGLTHGEFVDGIEAVADQLSDYENVMFDVSNESNLHTYTTGELAQLVAAVKSGDPSRVAFASFDQDKPGALGVAWADATESDVVASHQERGGSWWTGTTAWVRALISETSQPVYMQEPEPWEDNNFTAAEYIEAISDADTEGASGWVLHTRAGFCSHNEDFLAELYDVEREVLATYRNVAGPDITLMHDNGPRYVSTGDNLWNYSPAAMRTVIESGEIFALKDHNGGGLFDGDTVSFETRSSLWLQAEDGGGSGKSLRTTGTSAGSWEQFTIVNVTRGSGKAVAAGDEIRLFRNQSSQDWYVRVENSGFYVVKVDSTSPGSWETFRWIVH